MTANVTEYVYLIGSEENHLVKIGRSTNVPARIAALQSGSPIRLALLWQTEGGAKLEAALHRWFKPFRTHGEWFELQGGDALDQVKVALAEMAAAEQARLMEKRGKRKARKIRKVWRAPRPRLRPGRKEAHPKGWLECLDAQTAALITEAFGRAKVAQEAIEHLDALGAEHRRIRMEVIGRLSTLGVSQTEIARQISMSVPRVHEIARAAKRAVREEQSQT